MSEKAKKMLAGGDYIICHADACCDADKDGVYYCPDCGVRVFLHLPTDDSRITPYFAARTEPHKEGCSYYKENLFQTVSHLDHTGYGVDLVGLMRGFRHADRRPRPQEGGDGGRTVQKSKKEPEEEQERMIRREVRHPATLLQLYAILKNPDVTEYAGHDVRELIVDKSTISYYYDNRLQQTALVVGKRCMPPLMIVNRLKDADMDKRCLTIKAPYAVPYGRKCIYYILAFSDPIERIEALNRIMIDSNKAARSIAEEGRQRTEKRIDDKYLAMAEWETYLESENFIAYIGELSSTGCFHKLSQRYDCDGD